MGKQNRVALLAALIAGASGFAVGTAQGPDDADAASSGRVLRSIEREVKTLNESIGRTEKTGMRDDLDDAKDALEEVVKNTK